MMDAHSRVRSDLDRLVPLFESKMFLTLENGEAPKVGEAMRYSLQAGGKRVRPVLCMLAAEAVGANAETALSCARALEYVHTYSLIHDDLPAMDNDDLRRGKPTCHVAFGEGQAILAGDGLLTEAFYVIACDDSLSGEQRKEAVKVLSYAAGWRGMVGGQSLDLEGEIKTREGKSHLFRGDRLDALDDSKTTNDSEEARPTSPLTPAEKASKACLFGHESNGCGKPYDLEHLKLIHRLKTGALLRASMELGAVAGLASPEHREALKEAGALLGLAFQIQDDVLDATSTAEQMGKRVGKDEGAGKITYPLLLGLEGAKRALMETTDRAIEVLGSLPRPESLRAWARYLAERTA